MGWSMRTVTIAPSLICTDLCNLQTEVECLEKLGCKMLHVDIIDGRFSPDMPLGIDMVKQLRTRTKMIFDVHLMAADNLPYLELLLQCGADRICFHTEYEPRPTILLRKIRAAGYKAGIAISPETPISQIEHYLCLCDFVLVMRIDAGYAHLKGQQVYGHVDQKIQELRNYIYSRGWDIEIEADGRIGFDDIVPLHEKGVSTFVSGTKGIFFPEKSREENWEHLEKIVGGLNSCT